MNPGKPVKPALAQLILESAHQSNILPLTSTCNVRCVFCSHRQNPPGIEIYQLPPRSTEEIRETLDFIDPLKKIVIGESVTRIIEGEPFTHPEIKTVLTLISESFPATTVQLTTNGTMLDRGMAEFLARLGQVEINLSLNSSCAGTRARLMHDRQAPDELRVPPGLWAELSSFANNLRQKINVPLTVEPVQLADLKAIVAGVIAGSLAVRAGIKPGDRIIRVRGEAVYSRVDAFEKIRRAGGMVPLELSRGGEVFFTVIEKGALASSGLVMDYDIHPGLPAASRYFGGNIMSAGLLTVEDFAAAWAERAGEAGSAGGPNPDLILLPAVAFDGRGRDLTGRSYHELTDISGAKVAVC